MGTYRCGCGVERSYSRHGVIRSVPMCMRHGDGLSLRTVLGRRLLAWRGVEQFPSLPMPPNGPRRV